MGETERCPSATKHLPSAKGAELLSVHPLANVRAIGREFHQVDRAD